MVLTLPCPALPGLNSINDVGRSIESDKRKSEDSKRNPNKASRMEEVHSLVKNVPKSTLQSTLMENNDDVAVGQRRVIVWNILKYSKCIIAGNNATISQKEALHLE